MSVFIFILVIVVLILVHEFGHLLVAKWSGMRVDEFGIGYPPRAATLGRVGETVVTLNWLPFGGFVKIYGEDGAAGARSFASRPRFLQALTLVAGIAMNLLFAYVLLAGALYLGAPRVLAPDEFSRATGMVLTVASILPGSPAATAGLAPADTIKEARAENGASWSSADPKSFTEFVAREGGAPLTLSVERGADALTLVVTPAQGVVPTDQSRYALGVSVVAVGIVPLSAGEALVEGGRLTYGATVETAGALLHLFAGVFTLSADLSQVAGPVGIARAVGSASAAGFGNLLSLTALISINLALINLLPVPALDGGRLLFVLVEAVIRRPIKARVSQAVNAAGFAFLIILMVVVTLHDVFKLVG